MKIRTVLCIALFMGIGSLKAQVKEDISKTATDAGNKTEHATVVAKSAVVDNKYKDKVGKNGETIFIDHSSKYYFINSKGRKVYVSKSYLREKKA